MRNIAIALDVKNDNLPPASKTENLFPYELATAETGALAHWVFDRGGQDNFVDRVSGQLLTPQSDTYAFTEHSVVLDGAAGNGLLTPVTDSLGMLMFVVARKPAQNSVVFGGSIGPSGAGGFGLNTVLSSGLYARQRTDSSAGAAFAISYKYGLLSPGEWFFAAMYSGVRPDLEDGVSVFMGPDSYISVGFGADTPIVSSRKVAIGNGYFTGQGQGVELEIAEFGLISGDYLDSEKGKSILARTLSRMGERNINISLPQS